MSRHPSHTPIWERSIFPIAPGAATAVTLASFLTFYTGYDKASKTLSLSRVLDVVLVRKGVRHTLDELNKVFGLVGLSMLALRFSPWAPRIVTRPSRLLVPATSIVCLHGVYSIIRFTGTDLIPLRIPRTLWEVRRHGAVGLGMSNEIFLILLLIKKFFFKTTKSTVWSLIAEFLPIVMLLGGIAHFYGMEADRQGKVRIRPAGYAAALLAAITAGLLIKESISVRVS